MPEPKITRIVVTGAFAAGAALLGTAVPASADTAVAAPGTFTSAFTVIATPGAVVDANGAPAPGQAGSGGQFTFRLNSDLDIICYDITLTGVSGDYMSPAKTATHIHQSVAGMSGPPRIAFPNPAPVGDGPRATSGCLQGPFTTGVVRDGMDTGTGFTVSQIESDPAGFAADAHTVDFTAGVVRGQLSPIPATMG
jgi:CHRD domain